MTEAVAPAFRRAHRTDVPGIVAMLADDEIGREREAPAPAGTTLPPEYYRAFSAIDTDPNQLLLVADVDGALAGTLQLTFIPGLSRRGALRAQIEAVRVAGNQRGQGVGTAMLEHAIGLARERGCALVQLTADKRRGDAHRLYERLGFVASHEGMKLPL